MARHRTRTLEHPTPLAEATPAAARPAGAPRLVELVDLQTIPMPNGILGVAEVSRHIGFPVHRAYYIRDVPAGAGRGGHGHRNLRQCFLCLRGSVRLSISRSGVEDVVTLDRPSQAAVVGPGCWRDLSDFSDDSVVIVLASEEYDEADYIRDHDAFLAWDAGREPVTAVPYLDLARTSQAIGAELELAMRRVMKSGWFIGGEEVSGFEASFAAYCQAGAMVGVGNGLDALTLTLKAWGIGAGDEVIVPAHTFVASALAVDQAGATPVLVDVEPDTGLMDMKKLAGAIDRAHPRGDAGAPLRPPGRHGRRRRRHRRPRHQGARGRLPGARRAVQGPPVRLAGRRGGVQLLPDQEPRRAGRRRRGDHP